MSTYLSTKSASKTNFEVIPCRVFLEFLRRWLLVLPRFQKAFEFPKCFLDGFLIDSQRISHLQANWLVKKSISLKTFLRVVIASCLVALLQSCTFCIESFAVILPYWLELILYGPYKLYDIVHIIWIILIILSFYIPIWNGLFHNNWDGFI